MELGFLFYPPAQPDTLGHSRLDINLYAEPTGQHFDPHRLNLVIYDADKGMQAVTFTHPVLSSEYQVCIGKISLTDFVGKEVEAFTFGGTLAVINEETLSFCSLVSPAPIFSITPYDFIELTLVEEYEVELALIRGRHLSRAEWFEKHLAQTDPQTLFYALSKALLKRLKQLPSTAHNERYWHLIHSLSTAIQSLEANQALLSELSEITDLFQE